MDQFEEFEPDECLVSSQVDVIGVDGRAVFFTLGGELEILIEEYSSGRIEVTLMEGFNVGVESGLGGNVNAGDHLNLGADIDLGGGVSFPGGSTWIFHSKEDVNDFIGDVHNLRMSQVGKISLSPLGIIASEVAAPDLPDPDITRRGVGFDYLDGELDWGGRAGRGYGTWVDEWEIDPRMSTNGAVGLGEEVIWSRNEDEGTSTRTYTLEGAVELTSDLAPGEDISIAESERIGILEIKEDNEGKIVNVRIQQIVSIDGSIQQITTELPVESEYERDVVKSWIGLSESLSALPLMWESLAPEQLPSNPTPFDELLFNNAHVSRVDYSNSDDIEDYGAEIKIGMVFGFTGSVGDSSRDIYDAEYLGPPRSGEREYYMFSECV
ncbi:hypothetical protein RIF23_18290 [Lipingzhangella sp. LS1_29]|uniref:Uncharacterized protein n=1 Tax=Lipingzhangella rawalii TaxID=2055835 RepID=A0ABU2HAA4_9ACTN|nr:hypothetical protein [Lipingzhangella rawalii]